MSWHPSKLHRRLESMRTVLLSLVLMTITLMAVGRMTLKISVEIARVKSASTSAECMVISAVGVVILKSAAVAGLIIIVTIPARIIIIPAAPTTAPASCVIVCSFLASFSRLSRCFYFFCSFVDEGVMELQADRGNALLLIIGVVESISRSRVKGEKV